MSIDVINFMDELPAATAKESENNVIGRATIKDLLVAPFYLVFCPDKK
jgi:hypothetical protein